VHAQVTPKISWTDDILASCPSTMLRNAECRTGFVIRGLETAGDLLLPMLCFHEYRWCLAEPPSPSHFYIPGLIDARQASNPLSIGPIYFQACALFNNIPLLCQQTAMTPPQNLPNEGYLLQISAEA
jgi:hypothetical protein